MLLVVPELDATRNAAVDPLVLEYRGQLLRRLAGIHLQICVDLELCRLDDDPVEIEQHGDGSYRERRHHDLVIVGYLSGQDHQRAPNTRRRSSICVSLSAVGGVLAKAARRAVSSSSSSVAID